MSLDTVWETESLYDKMYYKKKNIPDTYIIAHKICTASVFPKIFFKHLKLPTLSEIKRVL